MAVRGTAAKPATSLPDGRERRGLSTGIKVFLILGAILLPLSMISILASAATGRTATADRIARLSLQLDALSGRLRRDVVEDQALVAASASAQAVALPERGDVLCRQLTERIRTLHSGRVGFVIADPLGRPVCAFRWSNPVPRPITERLQTVIASEELVLAREAESGWITTVRYPREELTSLLSAVDLDGRFRLSLASSNDFLVIQNSLGRAAGLFGTTELESDLSGLNLQLRATVPDLPPTAAQWISVGLPILMTIGSALIGWLLVNRLFTRNLGRLTRQIESYTPGAIIEPEEGGGGSSEVAALGIGLRDLSALVARNIDEVENGLERQTALTREVHHRVKNNLQVIASLISLHSRAADDPVARDAYRAIQRRVDALSVVHRNHFAGTEVSTGVSLSALVSELATGLQASSSEEDAPLTMRLEVAVATVTQDVATSIAFLVTELSELAMNVRRQPQVLTARTESEGSSICLSLHAPAFVESPELTEQLESRYERVLTGLSRQLRSPLEHDGVEGSYSVAVPVMEGNP